MTRPRILDLFRGAGGAATGYHRAGFDVVGMDIKPQPHYPFEFVRGDALGMRARIMATDPGFDAIHASPPCQAFTTMSNRPRGAGGLSDDRLDLLTPTLELLAGISLPWIVENVAGAKRIMPNPITLHGGMFGLQVNRPRLFSASFPLEPHSYAVAPVNPVGVYGARHDGRLLYRRKDGTEQHAAASLAEGREATGMDWADWRGTKEAIPPAYTERLGRQLLCHPIDCTEVAA